MTVRLQWGHCLHTLWPGQGFDALQRGCMVIFWLWMVLLWAGFLTGGTLDQLPDLVVVLGLLLPLMAGGVVAPYKASSQDWPTMTFGMHLFAAPIIALSWSKPGEVTFPFCAALVVLPLMAFWWAIGKTTS